MIADLHVRGLKRRVLVLVTGEFGRMPRVDYQPDSASGVTQPGRDQWSRASSLLFSGGGRPARAAKKCTIIEAARVEYNPAV